MDSTGLLQPEPVAILQYRSKQLRSWTITEVLVQWQGQSAKDATWESLYVLHNKFPHLVGKVLWVGGTLLGLFGTLRTRFFFKGAGLIGVVNWLGILILIMWCKCVSIVLLCMRVCEYVSAEHINWKVSYRKLVRVPAKDWLMILTDCNYQLVLNCI